MPDHHLDLHSLPRVEGPRRNQVDLHNLVLWLAVLWERKGLAEWRQLSGGLHKGYMYCTLPGQLWVWQAELDQQQLHCNVNCKTVPQGLGCNRV